ncbi:MAG: tripartite tricarboxylate transporter TctB family protein [Sphaerochaetaceae bacterium]|nr:tripartite tricarboxylate transporter TctB family protein [Sphaerochaetaceae bacterium]
MNSSRDMKNLLIGKNFLAGTLAVIFSVILLATTKKVSSAYPYVVFVMMLAFGMIVLIESIVKRDGGAVRKFTFGEIVLILFLIINPVLAKLAGFYVSAFLEILAISIFINPVKTKKSILLSVVFCLVVVGLSYLLFTYGLRIRCPRGTLSLF